MSILDTIVESKRIQFPDSKFKTFEERFEHSADHEINPFIQSLLRPGVSIIGEVKPSSPSAGKLLVDEARLPEILRIYREHCAAISVLTDEKFFNGSFELLSQVKQATGLPVLCKDFVISKEQIFLAKKHGADAILLIAKILELEELASLMQTALNLGLCPVVEINNLNDLELIAGLPIRVVLINNRNLDTMQIDLTITSSLANLLSEDQIIISASGIKTKADIEQLLPSARRFLIGTSLMSSPNPNALLKELSKPEPHVLEPGSILGTSPKLDASSKLEAGSKLRAGSKLDDDSPPDASSKLEAGSKLRAGSKLDDDSPPDSSSKLEAGSKLRAGPELDDDSTLDAGSKPGALATRRLKKTPSTAPRIKVCGITNGADATMSIDAGADFIGLIFVPSSKRRVTLEEARTIRLSVNSRAQIVGVFQDQTIAEVNQVAEQSNLDFIQLHGNEHRAFMNACSRPVIKVFQYPFCKSVSHQHLLEFAGAQYFLFDLNKDSTEDDNFDRFAELNSFLTPIKNKIPPFFLAGRLTPDNVQLAYQAVLPFGLDVASGVEISPGTKSTALTKLFCNQANSKSQSNAPQVVNK